MNYRMIAYSIGRILMVIAATMLLPLILSVCFAEGLTLAFLIPIAICIIIGIAFSVKTPRDRSIYAREGMVIVGVSWIVMSLIGALPFFISRQIPSFIDCFFETVSGFTTTGSTILTDVEKLSKSLIFWRSFTHWLGGLGVLAFTMAILSSGDTKTNYMMKAEMAGPVVGKIASKWQYSLRILYVIYIVLTISETILLAVGGMSLFDSLVHAFGTAGTGGFGIKNSSIAYYDSAYLQYVIAIFMMLFGVNFNVYYLLIAKKFSQVAGNEELKWYVGLIVGASLIIALNILPFYSGFGEAFRHSFFQVNSIITTTGYATADFARWPMLSQMIIVMLMFMGACAGSTGGGFKVIRTLVIAKTARYAVRKAASPRTVFSIKADGKPISQEVRQGVLSYFAAYTIFMVIAMLIISIDNKDFTTTVTSVISTVNNIGPGLGNMIGPTGSFAEFSVLSKIVLSICMLVGRLEVYPVLVLLSPYMWRRK